LDGVGIEKEGVELTVVPDDVGTMVGVEIRIHPSPKHVKPGMQQPPPRLFGQLE
jgi:hypothetical protein